MQTASQTTPVGSGSPNRFPVWGSAERDVVKIHKKAFIRADS